MEIGFQGQYKKDTIFKAVKLGNKPSKRDSLVRIGLVVLLLVFLVSYFISMATQQTLLSFEVFRSGRHLITIPVLLYFLLQPYISSYLVATSLYKNPVMQTPISGVISSQGIVYISSTGRREINWDKFAKKQLTENLIVLITADGTLSFFPRHFFKDENEWRMVLQWVNSKVVEPI